MIPSSAWCKARPVRGRGALVALAALLPLLLVSSGGPLAAAPPPPCFQQAPSLGSLLNSILVCWNGFTGEFELYFSPKTGIVSGGTCGNGGAVPLSTTGGTAHNPPNLLWEIHIIPDDLDPDPEDIISLDFRVRGYKKPVPLTPLEITTTRDFYPKAVMDSPSHCQQLFP